MAKVILRGRIAADAEKRVDKSGREYMTFRCADMDYNTEKNEDGTPKTYWYSVRSYENVGISQYLTKGKPVFIIGRYTDRVYQNHEGKCEVGRDILAYSVEFNSTDSNQQNGNGAQAAQSAAPAMQTAMQPQAQAQPKAKPTTADLKVPAAAPAASDDADDLPF